MDLFEVGEIVKTRGLHGCLKVLSYMETTSAFLDIDYIYIQEKSSHHHRFELRKIDVTKTALFVELQDINDVEAAKCFIGCKVFLPKDILKKLPKGEYYFHEIIGLRVFSEEGDFIGEIESIFPTGSNDVYVCRGSKGEILLPAIADVIKQIDVGNKKMTVRLLKGLKT